MKEKRRYYLMIVLLLLALFLSLALSGCSSTSATKLGENLQSNGFTLSIRDINGEEIGEAGDFDKIKDDAYLLGFVRECPAGDGKDVLTVNIIKSEFASFEYLNYYDEGYTCSYMYGYDENNKPFAYYHVWQLDMTPTEDYYQIVQGSVPGMKEDDSSKYPDQKNAKIAINKLKKEMDELGITDETVEAFANHQEPSDSADSSDTAFLEDMEVSDLSTSLKKDGFEENLRGDNGEITTTDEMQQAAKSYYKISYSKTEDSPYSDYTISVSCKEGKPYYIEVSAKVTYEDKILLYRWENKSGDSENEFYCYSDTSALINQNFYEMIQGNPPDENKRTKNHFDMPSNEARKYLSDFKSNMEKRNLSKKTLEEMAEAFSNVE